jgi:hypothetical protein
MPSKAASLSLRTRRRRTGGVPVFLRRRKG